MGLVEFLSFPTAICNCPKDIKDIFSWVSSKYLDTVVKCSLCIYFILNKFSLQFWKQYALQFGPGSGDFKVPRDPQVIFKKFLA